MHAFFTAWRNALPGVAANLTTAFLVFLASLTFSPVRQWLFGSTVATYPLICAAEPLADATGTKRIVELYIINRTEDEYTREQLQSVLSDALKGSGTSGTPSFSLPYTRGVGTIESAVPDAEFNKSKGELQVVNRGTRVDVNVQSIGSRAILRVLITVAGLPDKQPVERIAKSAVPFAFGQLQDACYGRN
jgi:hypothetical protein